MPLLDLAGIAAAGPLCRCTDRGRLPGVPRTGLAGPAEPACCRWSHTTPPGIGEQLASAGTGTGPPPDVLGHLLPGRRSARVGRVDGEPQERPEAPRSAWSLRGSDHLPGPGLGPQVAGPHAQAPSLRLTHHPKSHPGGNTERSSRSRACRSAVPLWPVPPHAEQPTMRNISGPRVNRKARRRGHFLDANRPVPAGTHRRSRRASNTPSFRPPLPAISSRLRVQPPYSAYPATSAGRRCRSAHPEKLSLELAHPTGTPDPARRS